MSASIRKVLNLTYAWLYDLIGGTPVWERDYAHYFDPEKHRDYDYVDVPQPAAQAGPARSSGLQIAGASRAAPAEP